MHETLWSYIIWHAKQDRSSSSKVEITLVLFLDLGSRAQSPKTCYDILLRRSYATMKPGDPT